jgi:hypothetical protein
LAIHFWWCLEERHHKALHWLKLNHVDYFDCEISDKNLASYPEEGPPVVVDYNPSNSNKNPESTSVHDLEEEDGTTEGPCPFTVHGLTGEEFSTKTMKTIKAIPLQHLISEGKILAIGHAEIPESIYLWGVGHCFAWQIIHPICINFLNFI